MKEALFSLYQHWHQDFMTVRSCLGQHEISGPFLVSPSPLVRLQKNRLLIVGQAANCWNNNVDDLHMQMQAYDYFNVGKSLNSVPFWNVVRKIEKVLKNEPYSTAWTNIKRFDFDVQIPVTPSRKIISTLDDILIDEIRIIKPAYCIFFTGPSLDRRLGNIFEGIRFQPVPGWDSRKLVKLKHPALPKNTYRASHPNYLRRHGFELKFIDFLEGIID